MNDVAGTNASLYLLECVTQGELESSHGDSEGADQKSCHSPVSGPEEEQEVASPRDLDNGDIWQHSSGSGGNKCVHKLNSMV
jgi:hypothetical protein